MDYYKLKKAATLYLNEKLKRGDYTIPQLEYDIVQKFGLSKKFVAETLEYLKGMNLIRIDCDIVHWIESEGKNGRKSAKTDRQEAIEDQ